MKRGYKLFIKVDETNLFSKHRFLITAIVYVWLKTGIFVRLQKQPFKNFYYFRATNTPENTIVTIHKY